RRSPGPVTIRDLAWPLAWVRSERALRPSAIRARIASTAPSRPSGAPRARPDWAARAGLAAPGGAARTASGGRGLARPAAFLPVRTAGLDDPDAGRGDVAGQ